MNRPSDAAVAPIPVVPDPATPWADAFAHVIELLPNSIIMIDTDGRIVMGNRRASQTFGYGEHELCGKPADLLLPDRLRGGGVWRTVGQPPAPATPGSDWRHWGLRKDGQEFPIDIVLHPNMRDGAAVMLAGITDATERWRIAREMERQRVALDRANADLNEFVYAASHDLKAPLRAIGHLAQWISEDIGPTASAATQENLTLLQGRVARLQQLLNGLLAYSKLGEQAAATERVDIASVVDDAVALLAPPAGFQVTYEGPLRTALTQRTPLQVVLENLIGNGIKHHDRAEGRVTVGALQRDGMLEFWVSDDGPGIPPRYHDRIFAIFQTLARRDEFESNGVGLAIVKRMVARHGGEIRVRSQPPARGTTMIFTWREGDVQ